MARVKSVSINSNNNCQLQCYSGFVFDKWLILLWSLSLITGDDIDAILIKNRNNLLVHQINVLINCILINKPRYL